MIILLSSAARPRYADDIVRVLALPTGAQMHFRYNRSWVEPSLYARIPREQLAGEAILVCFLAGDGKANPYTIVPVRYARLIRGEQVGSSCVFIFEAGAFVADLEDAAVRAATHATVRPKLPNPAPASAALFAFEAVLPVPCVERPAKLSAFEQTVDRVVKHAPFSSEDTAFFTVFRLSEIRGRSWYGTWPQPERLSAGAYRLSGGKRYECEVYCLRPNDPPTAKKATKLALAVGSEDEPITFASIKRGDIDSKYDVKRFVFFSEPTALSRVAGFRVFLAKGDEADSEVSRDVSVQVVLGGSLLLGPIRALLIGIGTAGPAMVAANAAGKLNDLQTVLIMALLGMMAGVAAIFPTLRKP
jgi:hypothetical protein